MRILLIDDNPNDRILAIRELSGEFSDLTVEQVSNRPRFTKALDAGAFDLVITDYHLRWTNGLEVLQLIKSHWPDCPVIMFTGTGSEEIAVEAMKAGLDDYILKSPRHFTRLTAAVRAALDKYRQRRALTEAENRFRHLFDGVPVGLYRTSPTRQFIEVNQALVDMLGLPDRKSLLGTDLADCYENRDDFERREELIKQKGAILSFETRLRRRDGKTLWVEDNARGVHDSAGRMLFFEGTLNNITSRRRVEEELRKYRDRLEEMVESRAGELKEKNEQLLREIDDRKGMESALRASEKKFRLLAENIPGVIYLCNNDERYTMFYLNDAVESLTGYPKQDFLDDRISFVDLYHPDDAQAISLVVDRALAEKRPFQLTYRIKHRSGQWRWVEEIGIGLFREGELLFLEGFLNDITSRKQADQEKTKLELQLRQSQKMEAVGRLAGGVAHDFNNLLTTIQGYSDLGMMQVGESNPLYEDLKKIRFAAVSAANLTRQLLLFSRNQPLHLTWLNINHSIRDLLDMLNRLIGEDIEVRMELADKLWSVRADEGNIGQVIVNLVVNARNAMPEGGILTIQTGNVTLDKAQCRHLPESRPGKFVQLVISDTGVGMDPETLQHIFEPFFTTRAPEEGTGLGLSVVYGIVKQHEGWITVSSRPDEGSALDVYLPASDVKVPEKTETQKSDPLVLLRGKGQRILFVEDEQIVRDFVHTGLSKNGYVVHAAKNVDQALRLFEKENGRFDLVISDVVMPNRSGLDMVDQVVSRNARLPILLISGYADQKSQWPIIRDRGLPFLRKPFTLSQLLQTVKEIIEM